MEGELSGSLCLGVIGYPLSCCCVWFFVGEALSELFVNDHSFEAFHIILCGVYHFVFEVWPACSAVVEVAND